MAYDNDKLLVLLGTDQLVELFNQLPSELTDKLVNSFFRKSAKILIAKAQENVRSLRLKNKKGRHYELDDSLSFSVNKEAKNVTVGTLKRRGGAYAPIFDGGTVERYTKNGRSTGRIKKSDFFKNAVDDTRDEIIYKGSIEFQERVMKVVARQNKKTKT